MQHSASRSLNRPANLTQLEFTFTRHLLQSHWVVTADAEILTLMWELLNYKGNPLSLISEVCREEVKFKSFLLIMASNFKREGRLSKAMLSALWNRYERWQLTFWSIVKSTQKWVALKKSFYESPQLGIDCLKNS